MRGEDGVTGKGWGKIMLPLTKRQRIIREYKKQQMKTMVHEQNQANPEFRSGWPVLFE